MPRTPVKNELVVGKWNVEKLRLTAFPRESEKKPLPASWADLVGNEPEMREARPREKTVIEVGPYEGGLLTLEVSPARANWMISIRMSTEAPPAELPGFGSFDEKRIIFTRLMKRWLRNCPRLHRLAFGAVLLLPVENRVAGYRQLNSLLPQVDLDVEHSTDFLFRINRRRPSRSGIKGLEINRLSTWSVILTSAIMLEISHHRSRVIDSAEKHSACRLEVDVNTAPEFPQGIYKTNLPKLFEELVDLADEIATKGDIP